MALIYRCDRCGSERESDLTTISISRNGAAMSLGELCSSYVTALKKFTRPIPERAEVPR